ncbi:MAG TPA: FAD-dependent oxidoreductase, partial [Planctomycetota bacterium]|nr:FAD-dependent oxidoreductase [Planctomycetota bacterium]
MTRNGGAPRRAFVLGGGVAGLVAAFGLRDRGLLVTLLESRGWLGGRAFSSFDRTTGRPLDNGPHVMLGCYREMRKLLRRVGTEAQFDQGRRLVMSYRRIGGRLDRLRLSRLPVPLAMPFALLRLGLPFGARWRALRGMVSVLRATPPSWSLHEWLRRRAQLGEPDAFLWRPLCRAIMNSEPDDVAAADFVATLREAFFGRAGAAAFWLPRQPWSELVGEPAQRALRSAGVTVRTGARVAVLSIATAAAGAGTRPRIDAIVLGDGERVAVGPSDLVVSALPWFAFRSLLPDATPPFATMRSAPIVSAFFETAEGAPLLPDDGPVTALVDGEPFHFVLRTPGASVRRFALLSGGNRVFDGMAVDDIAAMATAELARHYPHVDLGTATVRVRKEQHATFVAAPGSAQLRPAPGPLAGGPDNLRVCGDWTATGLPSTLEGAARSAVSML